MVTKTEFTFLSRNGKDQCHAISWAPENTDIRGVFQIIHGMQEYTDRYDAFATFLAEQGFLVVGADHLGHGKTAATEKDLGYFGDGDIPTILVRDAHRLKKIIQEQNPGKPYFIMGHSMGSFVLRKYLAMYKKGIDGAIILSTGMMPAFITRTGIIMCNFLKIFQGDRHRSRIMDFISFGSYLKRIPDATTASDWLSDNKDAVRAYREDPFCMYMFTLNGFRNLYKLVNFTGKSKNFTKVSKDLPILVIAGTEDPVGHYGKDPVKVYELFTKLGIKDVQLKLYDGMRHELLSSLNSKDVYDFLLKWITDHMR